MKFFPFRLQQALLAFGFLLGIILHGSWAGIARAQDKEDPLSFDRNISGLLRKYCFKCHEGEMPKGDVNLANDENPRLIAENAMVWRTALERIESKEMPPEGSRQPNVEERGWIEKFLHLTLDRNDCDGPGDPGRPSIRRLNRAEYDNSVRYLTGLDLRLAESFPADASSYGFDNIGASLTLTPVQVEQYYAAAQQIVTELLNDKASERPVRKNPIGYRRVYFTAPHPEGNDRSVAEEIVARFAERAIRKPVDGVWLAKLMSIYDQSRDQSQDHDHAIGNVLMAILISPRFLIRIETARPEEDGPYAIDDFDLASRLSFFLWSSPPDATLLKLARDKKLATAEVLDDQITRMLADRRSDALIDNFFAPWLQFDDLTSHHPDPNVFENFTEPLRDAITAEPRLVLRELIRKDHSITDLIDANYTYANQTLADHYGIADVCGDSMQRVPLSDRRRGGMLTMAALLMSQADPGRTNVPRRGNFIAGTILGAPAPPPPPDVPELKEPEGSDRPQTLRERLEAHRSHAQCASCHAKIDPLGFALENYDAVGKWRDTEVGKPIDASGELPDGKKFSGPVELKDILLERKDAFTRTFVSQLLIYALGRGPILADQCVIDDAVQAATNNDYRFSSIIRAIIHSYPFLHRQNADS